MIDWEDGIFVICVALLAGVASVIAGAIAIWRDRK
jgi:hypothetical protein